METKRTKVEVKYARTIQLKPYEPVVVSMATTLENGDSVSKEEYDAEMKSLVDYCDSLVQEILSKTE